MKKYPAIAVLEFKDIAIGIFATDAMVKKAPISLLKCGIVSHGKYLILIGGSTASVQESLSAGLACGGDSVIDHVFLPDVHPQVHDAVLGQRSVGGAGAMAIIETTTASSNVRAAELALKATSVQLVELRLADSSLSGKGVSVYRGVLHDIEAAVDVAMSFLKRSRMGAVHRVIPAPHDAVSRQVEAGGFFMESPMLDLNGEQA